MSRGRCATRGFTLVELISVSSMVALGLVMALPTVQKAREDARAQNCKQNLAKIGIALHYYNDTFNCLPPGWVARDDKPETGPDFSWQASLLPFLDQAVVFNTIDFHRPASAQTNKQLAQNLRVFRCPTDKEQPAADAKRGGFGYSTYAGNYGVDLFPGKENAVRTGAHGIFHWNSSVRFGEGNKQSIKDGLSNTLMVGERSSKTGGGIWPAVRSNQSADDAVATCNDKNRINTAAGSFSSLHEGGAYFLYGDASVRFVSAEIDSSEELDPPKGLFQKLANREDGQEVDLDQSTDYYQKPPKEVAR